MIVESSSESSGERFGEKKLKARDRQYNILTTFLRAAAIATAPCNKRRYMADCYNSAAEFYSEVSIDP